MISHGSPRSQSQPSLPNQPFFAWLRTQTALFISQIIGLLSVVSVPIALFYYSMHSLPEHFEWQKLELVGHYVIYAHLLFLFIFIAVLIRGLDHNNIGKHRASLVHEKLKGKRTQRNELEAYSIRQVGRFKRRFLGFWCAMLCLYLIFGIEPLFSIAPCDCLQALTLKQIVHTESFPFLSFVLNNVSLLFVFWCFSVLYLPPDTRCTTRAPESVPPKADATTIASIESSQNLWARFRTFQRRLVMKFSDPDIDERELRQRILVNSFVLLIAALTVTFPLIMFTKVGVRTNWSEFPAVFDALSGTINAIVLALLIARLDSKLLGLPPWLICVLYFYAGIQPMFVVFELHPEVYAGIKTAVLWVVFIFKIYFFLILYYSLQTGRLFNYFFCSQILNEYVKTLKQPSDSAAEAVPAAPSNVQDSNPPITVTAGQLSQHTAQRTKLEIIREDWRALWFKRLGVVAILLFAGLLLAYVSLNEDQKQWVDSSGLSDLVILLNLLLLLAICVVVMIARRREKKRGQPNYELRFEKPAELRFKLRPPHSAKDRALKFKELSERTNEQFKSFTRYFRLFWFALLVLYLAMWVSGRGKPIPSEPSPIEAIGTLSSLRVAAVAEHSQAGNSTPEKTSEPSSSSQVEPKRLPIHKLDEKVIYSFVFFIVNNVLVLILFLCFKVLYIPADDEKFADKDRLLRNYALLIFVILTVFIPLVAIIIKGNGFTSSEAEKIPTILGAIGGTLNAVAFALLIARLDSRIIGLRLLLIGVLYAYAALQPLFITFNQPSNLLKFIATSAMMAVFIFKLCLVLMVGHIRRSGGLIDYLWFFPAISNSVNSIFSNQYEIKTYSPKPDGFTFSIFNNNIETYRGSTIYRKRSQCDEAIKTLVNLMKRKKNYSKRAQELQGTYWVEVKSGDEVLCESRSLRSQSEADELINESVEEVPYCKYDRN